MADRTELALRAVGCRATPDPSTGDWIVDGCDPQSVIAVTDKLATDDARASSRVRAIAQGLSEGQSPRDAAAAIQTFVMNAIKYAPDDVQRIRPSESTLAMGVGNCLSMTRLYLALARAAGLDVRPMGVVDRDGELAHVAPQVRIDDEWTWVETTVDGSTLGETSYDAAARARVERQSLRRL